MSVLQDPRVKLDTSVSDEMYNITTPDGIWDVVRDENGCFVAAPPDGHAEGFRGSTASYDAWFARLPRFDTPTDAVASILDRY